MSAPDAPAEPRADGSAWPDHPLGLTVHSMPALSQSDTADAQRTLSGRLKMVIVLAICAAPVIASYVTYYLIRPEARRSFGELIEPQRPLPEQAVTALDGSPSDLRALKGQWLLVSVAGGACSSDCQAHLYLQRQLRESLGPEKERLDWVWLVSDEVPVAEALKPALKGASVLKVPAAPLAAWLAPAPGHRLDEHLYLVDPLGNWMMRFPAGLDIAGAARAKRDLDRLMRASASWDLPGR